MFLTLLQPSAAEKDESPGAGKSKHKYQVETRRGVVEVQTLEEVAALLKRAARPLKVVTDEVVVKVKPKTSASAISVKMAAAAAVAAEIDDEEFLLLHA
jgi:hypothetical protein